MWLTLYFDWTPLCYEFKNKNFKQNLYPSTSGEDKHMWLLWLVQAQECIYPALSPLSHKREQKGGKGRNSTWDQNRAGRACGKGSLKVLRSKPAPSVTITFPMQFQQKKKRGQNGFTEISWHLLSGTIVCYTYNFLFFVRPTCNIYFSENIQNTQ